MSENRFYQPEIDPYNGFEVVWRGGRQNATDFTLLKVSDEEPIKAVYFKPKSYVNLELSPSLVAIGVWDLNGIINSDTIQNMGMPVTYRRTGNQPTVVTEKDIKFLRRFGEVIPDLDEELFSVDISVKTGYATMLLESVWQPIEYRENPNTQPEILLDPQNTDYRIVPQKLSTPGRIAPHSFIKVHRL